MTATGSCEAVTFDFYGTLAFHREGRGRGWTLTDYLRSAGYEPGPWEHRILYRVFEGHLDACPPASDPEGTARYRMRLAERAFGELGVAVSEDEAARHAEPLWRILGPESLALFPEVEGTLAELDGAGVRMAVVSNWQSGLRHFLDELGILSRFEAVVCSDDLGVEKPDPAIFEEAASRLGVGPGSILHVGDTRVDDYEGSRGAGFHAVLIARGGAERPAGVHTIETLHEVGGLVGDAGEARHVRSRPEYPGTRVREDGGPGGEG